MPKKLGVNANLGSQRIGSTFWNKRMISLVVGLAA
jgi:hypothetical protein